MSDTLSGLSALSDEATHHKEAAAYFLRPEEIEMFDEEGWSLNWPAIIFSIDSDEVGAALAEQATRRRLREDGEIEETNVPFVSRCL